jgi:hypothetical protein
VTMREAFADAARQLREHKERNIAAARHSPETRTGSGPGYCPSVRDPCRL